MPDTDTLFDPGPPQAKAGSPVREGDRALYKPRRTRGAKYNRGENLRVRAMLHAHLEGLVPAATNQRTGNQQAAWGRVRGAFATDWVDLCDCTWLQAPGTSKPQRRTHAKKDPRVDAGRTILRRFQEGEDQADWVLLGIEATIAQRTGQPDPPGMRQRQEVLG